MATYKRVEGDYHIISVEDNDNVIIDTHTVKVYGNLDVVGNVTYIETNDLTVDDPFITVAGNNNGTIGTAQFQQQGLVTQTSNTTYAGLRFNNATLTWQISPSVTAAGAPISAYNDIGTASAGSAAGPVYSIQYRDVGNVFGGSAYYTVDYANSRVRLNGDQVFGNIGTAPAAVANSVAVYHNEIGSGGTGLYVKSSAVEDELVSKTKAIVFALIL